MIFIKKFGNLKTVKVHSEKERRATRRDSDAISILDMPPMRTAHLSMPPLKVKEHISII